MIFNSIDFAIFLPIVFVLYWFASRSSLRLQNLLIVVASYVFYGWWDWRFLALILFSTIVDYLVGIGFLRTQGSHKRKALLWTSVVTNLGLLGFFKYYNFFIENFASAFSLLGCGFHLSSLNIILPVGISFYTFQTMSYSIDIYKRRLEPTKDFLAFSAFVSFFPQLVAGPIERAPNLLPQFLSKRSFNYTCAVDGMRQILWGLFKKIVIADNCAEYADAIFNYSNEYSGGTLILGAVFFAFQIYGDFSGYSDIALGTSKLFGFRLIKNFDYPYFSRDIGEFWRSWHISLSTWFRDYLYIPLGGSRGGIWMKIRNTFIIFIVSGLWHGANWTFVAWGALNALYFLPLLLTHTNRKHVDIVAQGKLIPRMKELMLMFTTFCMTVFAWIFFRAVDIGHAFSYIGGIFSGNILEMPADLPRATILLILVFLAIEWLGREGNYAISQTFVESPRAYRWGFYLILCFLIFIYQGKDQEFIYFQF